MFENFLDSTFCSSSKTFLTSRLVLIIIAHEITNSSSISSLFSVAKHFIASFTWKFFKSMAHRVHSLTSLTLEKFSKSYFELDTCGHFTLQSDKFLNHYNLTTKLSVPFSKIFSICNVTNRQGLISPRRKTTVFHPTIISPKPQCLIRRISHRASDYYRGRERWL